MDNEKQNLIVEYVLSSETNLLLSSQIINVFDEIISRLVKDFLTELENELRVTLGHGWIIDNALKDNPFERWYPFRISKKKWDNTYWIGFNPEKQRLKEFCFYVWRNEEILKNPIDDIYEKLNNNYRKGRKYKVTDWYQSIDNPYLNWTNEETLIKLYRKTEMAEYFKNNLIKIKNIVEPIIDKEIKKMSK